MQSSVKFLYNVCVYTYRHTYIHMYGLLHLNRQMYCLVLITRNKLHGVLFILIIIAVLAWNLPYFAVHNLHLFLEYKSEF